MSKETKAPELEKVRLHTMVSPATKNLVTKAQELISAYESQQQEPVGGSDLIEEKPVKISQSDALQYLIHAGSHSLYGIGVWEEFKHRIDMEGQQGHGAVLAQLVTQQLQVTSVQQSMGFQELVAEFQAECEKRGRCAFEMEAKLMKSQLALWTGNTNKGLTGLFYRISKRCAKWGL